MQGLKAHRTWIMGVVAAVSAATITVAPFACHTPSFARAEPVTNRDQLIGGQDALGDVGDFKLSNGKVRFIIQGTNAGTGYSRGWGVYSGSLVDADLQRPSGSLTGSPKGNDLFGEMFPAYFLEALQPTSVEIGNSGADGNPASIVVKGSGQPFLTLARLLMAYSGVDFTEYNEPGLQFTNTFSLGPNDQFLTITTTLAPNSSAPAPLTVQDVTLPVGADVQLSIPLGWVVLFGNQNNPFVPGPGFDMYYSLQDAFKHPATLPAFGGLLTDLIATQAPGVSYGIAVKPPAPDKLDTSYVYHNESFFSPHQQFFSPQLSPPEQQMLIPFIAGSFTGVFAGEAPASIPVGGSFSYVSYFMVGQGDVGSVRDVYYGIRGTQTGTFSATIKEVTTHNVVPAAYVVVLKDGLPFSQYQVNSQGQAIGTLEPGNYTAVAVCDNRERFAPVPFTIQAGGSTQIAGGDPDQPTVLAVPRNSVINVMVQEQGGPYNGRPLPAKITLVGSSPENPAWDGLPPRKYLYDLTLGDRMLPTATIPCPPTITNQQGGCYDHNNPATFPYIERVVFSDTTGLATGQVYPGTYQVLVSHGPEYNIVDLGTYTFAPGQSVTLGAQLTRILDTTGYISADFHVHSNNSIDGQIDLNTRLIAAAAEGLESATSTDHNYVTDYTPWLRSDNLENYMRTEVGIELTTIEMGHFNSFPLLPDLDSVTYGAFLWNNMTPDQVWNTLRCSSIAACQSSWGGLTPAQVFGVAGATPLGTPNQSTVIEMNHARDGTLGYFNQLNVDQDTGLPVHGSKLLSPNSPSFQTPTGGSTLSWNFDAMEVYNAKRRELVRTERMPNPKPAIEYCQNGVQTATCVNMPSDWPAGAIIRTPCDSGTVCTDAVYAQQPIANPGEVEDWFNILNMGGMDPSKLPLTPEYPDGSGGGLSVKSQIIHPVTATGNSDSHSVYFAEPGEPRNWVFVNKDDPRQVTDEDISAAVLNHQVIESNGPYVTVIAQAPTGAGCGSTLGSGPTAQIGGLLADSADSVCLHITVQAAPWTWTPQGNLSWFPPVNLMPVDKITIYTNVTGAVQNDLNPDAAPIVIPLTNTPGQVVRFDQVVSVPLPGGSDAWIVVIADTNAGPGEYTESMFPIITTLEQPSLYISDALSAIEGPLGLSGPNMGPLLLPRVDVQSPFAITNPIWIDGNGDGVSFGRDNKFVKFTSSGRTSVPQ